MRTVTDVTPRLFPSQVSTPVLAKMLPKFSKVKRAVVALNAPGRTERNKVT